MTRQDIPLFVAHASYTVLVSTERVSVDVVTAYDVIVVVPGSRIVDVTTFSITDEVVVIVGL